MGTPYPTTDPGYLPASEADRIVVPEWIGKQLEDEARKVCTLAFRQGYQTGFANSSDQYTEETDLPRTLRYILERQDVAPDTIDKLINDLRRVLPEPHGGRRSPGRGLDFPFDDLKHAIASYVGRSRASGCALDAIAEVLKEEAHRLAGGR